MRSRALRCRKSLCRLFEVDRLFENTQFYKLVRLNLRVVKPTLCPGSAGASVRMDFGMLKIAQYAVGEYVSRLILEHQHRFYSQPLALAIELARCSPKMSFTDEG